MAVWLVIGFVFVVASNLFGFWLLFRHLKQPDNLDNLRQEHSRNRKEAADAASQMRTELDQKINGGLTNLLNTQQKQTEQIIKQLSQMSETMHRSMETNRTSFQHNIKEMREGNEHKLDEIKKTVDEKLQATLEKRFDESFTRVDKQLAEVQKGLGEMQAVATGVGDLKKVLSNVSARGHLGERQLQAILEEILTPTQYEKNVAIRPLTQERVEFAVKLPGQSPGEPLWLPIDSKFPQEDLLRIQTAIGEADEDSVGKARASLKRSLEKSAKEIATKYIHPPDTTDFAVMFLPTESLYAEALQMELSGTLYTKHRVTLAGPTTLAALLSSLRIGFQTLAVKEGAEGIRKTLEQVKKEFNGFSDALDKARKQLNTASNTIEETHRKTQRMSKTLTTIEMPAVPAMPATPQMLEGAGALLTESPDDS